MKKAAVLVVAACLSSMWGQQIQLPPGLEKLAEKAEESVVVTLDRNMLRLLGKFDKDSDASRRAMDGLESITVRSFEFAFEDEYKKADVDALRAQFQAPGWSRIVGVRSSRRGDDGDVDVYFKDGGNGTLAGIVIIAAEPREFTFVSIVGTLHPEQLADLGGQFHIPRLDLGDVGRRRDRR